MQIICDYNPNVFEYVPPSFIFPQEQVMWEEYDQSHPKCTYIAKPKVGAQGEGI